MPKVNDQFDEQELAVLLRELGQVLVMNLEGDIVELGCYKGQTSVQIGKALKLAGSSDKKLYLYDSFAGLPEKSKQDQSPAGEQFRSGELPATKQEVVTLFKKSNLPLPIIKKAWFKDLKPKDLPDKIAFAFLDGDFYESVKVSLELIWPLLSPSAIVVVDDYQNEALPGVQKAVDDWLIRQPADHPAQLQVEASLAIIQLV